MAPYSFMFMAPGATSEAEAREILTTLGLGSQPVIDRVEVTEGLKAGMAKFFVHYSDMKADKLRAELDEFASRKAAGEMNVQPKRIVYGVNKHGKEMYWQIFKCATPEQREAEREGKTKVVEFTPRVE
jgi:hypothetical protein